MSEQEKYEKLWGSHPSYRAVAPGQMHAGQFLELAKPTPEQTITDFGCGTGRGALAIHQGCGAAVTMLDFADNCLDEEVSAQLGERFRFRRHDLTQPVGEVSDHGICTDVLEHVPPEDVDRVLTNIVTASRRVYLAISTVPDHMGRLIGETLHLTVESAWWWHDKLTGIGFRVDWSRDYGEVAVFYGSAYASAADFEERAGLNATEERLKQNIVANLELGLPEIAPHEVQVDTLVYVLAGGPSLNDHEEEIVRIGRAGGLFVTVNGTYKWLLDRGIKPAAHIMIDARPFNERFVEQEVDSCRYLISSQCAHEAVARLPKDRTWLWHTSDNDVVKEAFDEFCRSRSLQMEWYPVYGGSTVVSRGLTLLAMLGFRKIEVFGWDSCLRGDDHHAYAQPENDSKAVYEVTVGGRLFRCHPWMLVQANELQSVMRHIFGVIPDFELSVRGDGLIAHMLNHAAHLWEVEHGSIKVADL